MDIEDGDQWLAVIARSLAYLALHRAELGNSSVGDKAAFLEGLGLPRADVAVIVGSSVDSVSELLRVRKKKGRKSGKK